MIRIMTCNSSYENGKCVGGYHEIHTINFMTSTKHIIATVKSIAENNAEFKDDNTVLECILIESPADNVKKQLEEVVAHFQENPTVCKIEIGLGN